MIVRPIFSVIMPAFNCEATLGDAIVSVLSQTFSDFELIVVDDCSLDSSRSIAESYARKDSRIKIVCLEKNKGVAEARNAGIYLARGRYIAFLDSDDLWLPEKLEAQHVEFCQGAQVVYGSYVRFYPDGVEKQVRAPSKTTYRSLLYGNCIGNLTAAYDSFTLGKYYQESIGHEDYLMWLHILSSGVVAKGVEWPLARYRVGEYSLSGNKVRAAAWTWRIYREKLGLSFVTSAYYFGSYVASALFKRV